MSLELLSKLESKIQTALETIELQKMELEEERLKAEQATGEKAQLQQAYEQVAQQNEQLKQELQSWNEKVTGLVGLLNQEAL